MDEQAQRTAFVTAMTTEHFVLQTAYSSTIAEAAARSTLYVMALSSALVALGFISKSPEVFIPFIATVLPAVFLAGVFTVVRLVDTGLESMHYLTGVARIRGFYRTLGLDAETHFSAKNGRWPEVSSPALKLGRTLAFLGTTASMIAVINNVVAGAATALLVDSLLSPPHCWISIAVGIAAAVLLTVAFLAYQRWRFALFYAEEKVPDGR
jgi:hypothetical protein